MSSPHFSMGKSKRRDINDSAMNKVVPGPGHYPVSKFNKARNAPKWGFGSGIRPALNTASQNGAIGPGDYKIPSKVVEGP
jgi:hypothetical protein